jgi:hypothetical protein
MAHPGTKSEVHKFGKLLKTGSWQMSSPISRSFLSYPPSRPRMLGLELIPLGIQAIYAALTFQAVAFYDPNLTGGSMLNNGSQPCYSFGPRFSSSSSCLLTLQLGAEAESPSTCFFPFFHPWIHGLNPTQVIISGLSSPEVLTDAGLLHYAQAIGL